MSAAGDDTPLAVRVFVALYLIGFAAVVVAVVAAVADMVPR